MIAVIISNYGTVKTQYAVGLTASKLLQKVKEENGFHFKGNPTLQDVHDNGRIMSELDEILDDRTYYLTAWLEEAESA